jgi:hypothetical protein
MEPLNESDLRALIDRELRQLPELPAPATLVHRVMLAVHAKARLPWWKRPWLIWPLWARLISALWLLAAVGAVCYAAGATLDALTLGYLWAEVGAKLKSLLPAGQGMLALLNALVLVLRAWGQPVLLVGTAIVLTWYFAFVGLGTACFRVALRRA